MGFLTSPVFDATKPHCFIFEYEVSTNDNSTSPTLDVFMRCKTNLYSGKLLWGTNHEGNGVMVISIPAAERIAGCYLDFIGHQGSDNRNKVAITDIQLLDNVCSREDFVACPDGYFVCQNESTAKCVDECIGTECLGKLNEDVSSCGEINSSPLVPHVSVSVLGQHWFR